MARQPPQQPHGQQKHRDKPRRDHDKPIVFGAADGENPVFQPKVSGKKAQYRAQFQPGFQHRIDLAFGHVLPFGHPPISTITAPTAINAIRAILRGPTVSFSTSQPMSAANTVEVSRRTAASPTLSSRVASITAPNDPNATTPPITPRTNSGAAAGGVGMLRQRIVATTGITKPSTKKNHARKVNGSAAARIP